MYELNEKQAVRLLWFNALFAVLVLFLLFLRFPLAVVWLGGMAFVFNLLSYIFLVQKEFRVWLRICVVANMLCVFSMLPDVVSGA